MFNAFLKIIEDTERPLLGPNYWILKKSSLLLSENKISRIVGNVMHTLLQFFVITQWTELYIKRENINDVFTNLRITVLSFVCAFKAINFIIWQKDWKTIIEYVSEADKSERHTLNQARLDILNKYTKYSRRATLFYWTLVFITYVDVVTAPYIFLASPSFRERLKNGTESFPHIFSAWIPIDKNNFPGNCITIVWQTLMCACGALAAVAYDTTVIVIMVFFRGKLDLLEERCKTIFESRDTNVLNTIAELHSIHILLVKHAKLFDSLMSPVMFVYVVLWSLMICISTIQLQMTTSSTQLIMMVEYLIFGIAQLFLFCWHSNDVRLKFQQVMSGAYESGWYLAEVGHQKEILLLMGQLRLSHTFKAGPFTDLTLPTFVTIIKGAYSYYTLLR